MKNNDYEQSLSYADTLLKQFAIAEYKIMRIIDGGQCNDFFEDCANILNNYEAKDLRAVNFKSSILNYRARGELFDNSAPFIFKLMRSCSSFKAVLYAQHLCYELSAVINGQKANLPDYNYRAVETARLFNVEEKVVYNNIKEQIKEFKHNKRRVEVVFPILKNEIKKMQEFLQKGIQNYYLMGGEKESLNEKDKKAGILLADLTEKINFASVLRESVFVSN